LTCKIEIEVQSLEEFSQVISLSRKPNIIMLDNMNIDYMRKAVEIRNKKSQEILLEASGGVNEDNILEIAETGIDFISVGSLTHSTKILDIHLIIF
ncbi:MAG: hypothetical protein LBH98_08305, partial [Chitinispirillales bacterium]|nr:hypothetical protein [Chitinispirillales bacterium]